MVLDVPLMPIRYWACGTVTSFANFLENESFRHAKGRRKSKDRIQYKCEAFDTMGVYSICVKCMLFVVAMPCCMFLGTNLEADRLRLQP